MVFLGSCGCDCDLCGLEWSFWLFVLGGWSAVVVFFLDFVYWPNFGVFGLMLVL